jgi:hypothetical protein
LSGLLPAAAAERLPDDERLREEQNQKALIQRNDN